MAGSCGSWRIAAHARDMLRALTMVRLARFDGMLALQVSQPDCTVALISVIGSLLVLLGPAAPSAAPAAPPTTLVVWQQPACTAPTRVPATGTTASTSIVSILLVRRPARLKLVGTGVLGHFGVSTLA